MVMTMKTKYTCPKLSVFGDVQTLTNQESFDVNQMMTQLVMKSAYGLMVSFDGL
jgi:hypothetical protein